MKGYGIGGQKGENHWKNGYKFGFGRTWRTSQTDKKTRVKMREKPKKEKKKKEI